MTQAAPKNPREKDPRKQELEDLRADIKHMQGLLRDLSDHSQDKLKRAKKMVASVPEGAALLKLAKKLKTPIVFNSRMSPNLAGVTQTVSQKFNYSAKKGLRLAKPAYKISLDPHSTTRELAVTIAHELRHVWQNVQLDAERELTLSPKLSMVLERLQEGDARAFEKYFSQRLDEKTKGLPRKPFTKQQWKEAFLGFQKKKSLAGSYDKGVVNGMGMVLRKIDKELKATPLGKNALSKVFNQSAAKGLKGASKILRAGLSKGAQHYITFRSEAQMVKELTSYARKDTQQKLDKLERFIKTGKMK